MKIKRTELRAVSQQVDDAIVEMAHVPAWLGETLRQNCDCCGWPIQNSETLAALRLASGNVMLVHAGCIDRLTRADDGAQVAAPASQLMEAQR
jgi:hypothetical protein